MADDGLMWYRVELDRSGAILKCEEVEAAQAPTKFVRFVQASSRAQACRDAKSWHEARKAKHRGYAKNYRARQTAQGKCCQCNEPSEPGHTRCRRHLEQMAERSRKFRAGSLSPRPVSMPEKVLEKTRDTRRKCNARLAADAGGHTEYRRMLHYRECLTQFDALGPEAFRAWLVSEIERRTGGRAAVRVGQAD